MLAGCMGSNMSEDQMTVDDRVQVSKFIQCVQLFRALDPNIRIGPVRSFLTVALNENMTVGEVARRTGSAVQTVSNHLRTLGEGQDKNGRPSLGLIASRRSPFDAREVVVRMTPKGHALVERMRDITQG